MHTRSPGNTWRLLHRGIKTSMTQRPTYTPKNTGDSVWCLNEVRKEGVAPKLQPTYTGPHLILQNYKNIDYLLLKEQNSKPMVVHHNKLKPYEGAVTLKWARRQLRSTECNCRPSLLDAVATRVTYTDSVVSGLVCCPPCGKVTRGGRLTGASCATGKQTTGMASHMWRRFMENHLPFAAFPVIFVLPR